MSGFPWNFIWLSFVRFRVGESKIISSVVLFWSFIVVLYWVWVMDSIVAVWMGLFWERRVRVRIPMRVRIR